MLGKVRADDKSSIKTVKLARGTFNVGSPSRAMSVSSGRASVYTPGNANAITPGGGLNSSGLQVLGQIGIVELLEQDERPTFIIDLGNAMDVDSGPLEIAFANAALRASEGLLDLITGHAITDPPVLPLSSTFLEFKQWAISCTKYKDHDALNVGAPSYLYGNTTWTCSTLRNRLRLISGNYRPVSTTAISSSSRVGPKRKQTNAGERLRLTPKINGNSVKSEGNHKDQAEAHDYFGDAGLPSSTAPSPGSASEATETTAASQITETEDIQSLCERFVRADVVPPAELHAFESDDAISRVADEGFFDWTRLPLSPSLPPHIHFAKSVDWAKTSLGSMEHWPAALRGMCNLIMASPHPAAMYWGDEYIAVYNEAYIPLAGQKHPALMGQSYREAWAEIWDDVEDVFESARTTGEATMKV